MCKNTTLFILVPLLIIYGYCMNIGEYCPEQYIILYEIVCNMIVVYTDAHGNRVAGR